MMAGIPYSFYKKLLKTLLSVIGSCPIGGSLKVSKLSGIGNIGQIGGYEHISITRMELKT
jgi:hypothetical protein